MCEWANTLQPSVEPGVRALLDHAFEIKDYVATFPQVFCEENLDNLIIERDERQAPIALCALHPIRWLVEERLWRGFCLGSVATHAAHRGKGLGKSVVARAVEVARGKGGDFIFLFSSATDFYGANGFAAMAPDYLLALETNPTNHRAFQHKQQQLNAMSFGQSRQFERIPRPTNLEVASLAQIWRAYCRLSKPTDGLIHFTEFARLATIPQMELFLLRRNSAITAIIFLGKGGDFPNCFHSAVFQDRNELMWLIHCAMQARIIPRATVHLGSNPALLGSEFEIVALPNIMAQSLSASLKQTQLPLLLRKKLCIRGLQSG